MNKSRRASLLVDNRRMVGKLAVVALLMFGFGYALVPMYRAICTALGINVLSVSEKLVPGHSKATPANTQVDTSRTITVEFDANARKQATPHFNKLECFCFNEYTLKPGESRQWPVVFVIDPKLPKDVKTITLSYTFFEIGGKVAAEVKEPQS